MRRWLTNKEVWTIGDLRGKSWSMSRIAVHMEISEGAVSYWCLKNGFEPAQPLRNRDLSNYPAITYREGGVTVRRYTPAEDRAIHRLTVKGVSDSEIARRLKRAPNSVLGRKMTLARREQRDDV